MTQTLQLTEREQTAAPAWSSIRAQLFTHAQSIN